MINKKLFVIFYRKMFSQTDQKAVRQNTLKLWICIIDRETFTEISEDMKSLVGKGVDVNLTVSGNTALHEAIERNDVKLTQVLLKLDPDLTLKNKDGETQHDLAEKLGRDDIVSLINVHENQNGSLPKLENIVENFDEVNCSTELKQVQIDSNLCLKNDNENTSKKLCEVECPEPPNFPKSSSKYRNINSNLVGSLDFESFSTDKLPFKKSIKVLKVSNCPSVTNVAERIKACGTFEKCTYLFVVIIEVEEIEKHFDINLIKILKINNRPLIVQITAKNRNPRVYFKEETQKNFSLLKDDLKSNQKGLELDELLVQNGCNLQNVFYKFIPNCQNQFNGNLLKVKIESKTFKSIVCAAEGNVLCLRFLQLFLGDREELSDFVPIISALKYDEVGTLLTLLEFPFPTSSDYNFDLNESQRKKLQKVDKFGQNLLFLIALKRDNVEAVKFLLKNGVDVRNEVKYAFTACDEQCYKCLVPLIQFDSHFPANFDINLLDEKTADQMRKIIKSRATFHKAIRSGSIEKIKWFINTNPQLKVACDINNKSALKTALEAEQFSVFSMFIAQGFSNGPKRKVIRTVSSNEIGRFFELLSLPLGTNSEKELDLNEKQRKILHQVDKNGFSLLMKAVIENNIGAVEFLLKNGADANQTDVHGTTAVDFAWAAENYECLPRLITYDSYFPVNFNISALDEKTANQMTNIVETRASFHDSIRSGSVDKIKKFVNEDLQVKIACDEFNKSALKTSLEAEQYEIFSMLIAQGFSNGSGSSFDETFQKLSITQQEKVKNANKEYFKSSEASHLFHLLSKSKLGPNSKHREKSFEVIRKMYEELNQMSVVHLMIKVIQQSKSLEIIFDFKKQHVLDFNESTSSKTGFIKLGMKNHESKTTWNDIKGVIAYEFTSYAFKLGYNDKSKHNRASEKENKDRLDEIVNDLQRFTSANKTNKIILNVFASYPRNLWGSELIVRVPQLLATYTDDRKNMKKIRKTAKDLFDIFDEVTMKDMESECSCFKKVF